MKLRYQWSILTAVASLAVAWGHHVRVSGCLPQVSAPEWKMYCNSHQNRHSCYLKTPFYYNIMVDWYVVWNDYTCIGLLSYASVANFLHTIQREITTPNCMLQAFGCTLDENIRGTRAHSWKLAKLQRTRDCWKYFFSNIVINRCYQMDQQTVGASSIIVFKKTSK